MKYFFLYLFFGLPLLCCGQKDSTSIRNPLTYPDMRPVIIQFDQVRGRNFSYRYNGQTYQGKVNEDSRISTNITAPLLIKKQLIIATTLNYNRQDIEYSKTDRLSSEQPTIYTLNKQFNETFSFSLGSVIKDSLFGKPLTFISNIYFDSRNLKSIDRIRGVAIATMNLKKTEFTKIAVGVAYLFNSTSNLPVCPILRYWHRFNNSSWMVDATLPKSIYFRKQSINSSWLSLGAEGVKNTFISKPCIKELQGEYYNSSTEIRGGLSYEYPLHSWVLLGMKTGVSRLINSRVSDLHNPTDNLIRGSGGFAPYLSFNVSLTPVLNYKK